MNEVTNCAVPLLDGTFFAPTQFVDALIEESFARDGYLTVAEAASLCEKWGKDQGERA